MVSAFNSSTETLPTRDYDIERLRFNSLHDDRSTYIVKMDFGNPSIPLYLLPDTRGTLFWTQCEPCIHRYNQTSPIYNSTASLTFVKLPCEHPFCRNNNSTFWCVRGECVYKVEYYSGSVTGGIVASEMFQPSGGPQMEIYFGCSKNNQNFGDFEHNGKIDGIMGLTMSPESLLYQLSNVTQCRFSYCLTPLLSQGNNNTLLRFGDDIPQGRYRSTPIVSRPNEPFFYINLLDISVEGRCLNIPRGTFARGQDGNGGFVVDSGTPVTRLINPAYLRVMAGFQAYFDSHGLQRVVLPDIDLQLCYKMSPMLPKYASMTYHFEGAYFEVDSQNLYFIARSRNTFCVEMWSALGQTILGSLHQVNTRSPNTFCS